MNYFSSGKGAGKKSGKSVVFFQKTLGPPRRWSLLLSFWYHTDDNRLLQSEIYVIASLESFGSKQCGPHWPRRGPKRDEKDRRWSWWFSSLLGDHIQLHLYWPLPVFLSFCKLVLIGNFSTFSTAYQSYGIIQTLGAWCKIFSWPVEVLSAVFYLAS